MNDEGPNQALSSCGSAKMGPERRQWREAYSQEEPQKLPTAAFLHRSIGHELAELGFKSSQIFFNPVR